jgi:protein gp138
MDQRERLNDPEEALRVALEGHQAGIWTALPGILQSFDAGKMTSTVQPAVQGRLRQQDGTWKDANLPVLLDCPVIFPAGGGFALTFPLAKGDEGLVLFSSRCIDAWWYSGGIQKQARWRMHDLSDGFFLPGCFSQPRKLANVSTANVQLRNAGGSASLEITSEGVLNANFPAGINLNGPINLNGVVSGNVHAGGLADFGNTLIKTTNDVQVNGKSLKSHVHLVPTGGDTGPPL